MFRTACSSNQNGLRAGHQQAQQQHSNSHKSISPKQHRHGHSQSQQQQSSTGSASGRKDYVVMPTQFLLGGNVNDPLNLAALTDQSEANQRTPVNSPLPTPQHKREIEVLIPADLNDPLRLNQSEADGRGNDTLLLCRPLSSPLKFNARNKRNNNGNKRRRCDSDGAMIESKLPLDLTPRKRTRCSPILNMCNNNSNNKNSSVNRTPYTRSAAARANACNDNHQHHHHQQQQQQHCLPLLSASDPSFLRRRAATMSQMQSSISSSALSVKRDLFTMHDHRPPINHQTPSLSCVQPIFTNPPNSISNNVGSASLNRTAPSPHPSVTAHGQPPQRKYSRPERRFQYGNYNRYYGYRNGSNQQDTRLALFKREWFENLDVLDIGCNVGHLTLSIARDLNPNRIVGVDIDAQLIRSARSNIRNYLSKSNARHDSTTDPLYPSASEENDPINVSLNTSSTARPSAQSPQSQLALPHAQQRTSASDSEHGRSNIASSPERCVLTDSPRINVIEEPECNSATPQPDHHLKSPVHASTDLPCLPVVSFPQNVRFFSGNYVLTNDHLLDQQSAEYNTILCMSVTKWVHLNWGDDGLKRLFKRVYRQLRPGGHFILEPQPWSSYCRKKGLTVSMINIRQHSIGVKL